MKNYISEQISKMRSSFAKKIKPIIVGKLCYKDYFVALILSVVLYAVYVYITTDMDDTQATIVAAKATKIQAVAAVMMLFVTFGLVFLSKLQTQTMQTQISLSLHEKRYKIYTSLI